MLIWAGWTRLLKPGLWSRWCERPVASRLAPSSLRAGWGAGMEPSASVCTLRLIGGRSRGFVPAAESLSFVSPKESNQRKATPLRVTLRFAMGNLRCSLFAGSAQTRFAQTRAALIREKLRSSARAEGIWAGPSLRSATKGLAARGLEQVRARARTCTCTNVSTSTSTSTSTSVCVCLCARVNVSEHRRLPAASPRVAGTGVAFLWLLSLARRRM